MKKQIGVKLGVTFALLFSFLFSTPTLQYQVEAAKAKTEEKAKIKRVANKKVTVKVKKYIDGDTTRFKLKNGKNVMFGRMANSYKKPLPAKAWEWYAVLKVKTQNIKRR